MVITTDSRRRVLRMRSLSPTFRRESHLLSKYPQVFSLVTWSLPAVESQIWRASPRNGCVVPHNIGGRFSSDRRSSFRTWLMAEESGLRPYTSRPMPVQVSVVSPMNSCFRRLPPFRRHRRKNPICKGVFRPSGSFKHTLLPDTLLADRFPASSSCDVDLPARYRLDIFGVGGLRQPRATSPAMAAIFITTGWLVLLIRRRPSDNQPADITAELRAWRQAFASAFSLCVVFCAAFVSRVLGPTLLYRAYLASQIFLLLLLFRLFFKIFWLGCVGYSTGCHHPGLCDFGTIFPFVKFLS